MKKRILLLSALALTQVAFATDLDPGVESRVTDIMAKMSMGDKIDLLSGDDMETHAIPRAGIPTLNMTDGALGVRWDQATAFPAGIAMAATFNTELLNQEAIAIGVETKALGRDMLLGPNVNMSRVPQGGRGFESFGEDPYLTSTYASVYVTGLQSQKVLASTKHFLLNDQEYERFTVNVQADERTMREIYMPPFLAAVQAGTWTVMAAYNQANGAYATENKYLLEDVLKGEWGFKGFVVSDWGATHSTVAAANAGLDLEMPDGQYFGSALRDAVANGDVSEPVIDDKVRRILRAMISNGIFEETSASRPPLSAVNSPEHQQLARKIAEESIVLLKNDKDQDGRAVLPLDAAKIKSIAVIGPNAKEARAAGGGSSEVSPFYTVSPLQGLQNYLGSSVQLNYALGAPMPDEFATLDPSFFYLDESGQQHGLNAEYFNNMDLSGDPVLKRVDANVDFNWGINSPAPGTINDENFSARWTGKVKPDVTGDYTVYLRSDDGSRVWIDGQLVVDNWSDHGPTTMTGTIHLEAGKYYDFKIEYYQDTGGDMVAFGWTAPGENLIQDAVNAASKSDVALIFAGLSDQVESEGSDRTTLDLPVEQISLIQAVAAANPRTIVILNSGEPVLVNSWINSVPGLLQAWYFGQEGGNAVTGILFGEVNPSGKLPVTFLKRWEDSSAYASYPGSNGVINYSEGIFVGYRYMDKNGIEPQFPFGFGLSYTKYFYSLMDVATTNSSSSSPMVDVWVTVTNTGLREGSEVVQLYVAPETPEIVRAVQELKGFTKVHLKPFETARVHLQLDRSAFQYFDADQHAWRVAPGKYQIRIGSSSRDIRQTQEIQLN